ncbi:MAG: hypothetical protein KGL51_04560 [Betaproteobacteria bacterium]|nr:hypothetical protein [Betaproteobacteria bacterium]
MLQIAVRSGREIRLGPRWPDAEATLAFDSSSGDFWVLDAATRSMLEALLQHGPLDERRLQNMTPDAPRAEDPGAAVWASRLQSVIDAGLLVRCQAPQL